jgi:2-haloacid dehalogenase
VALKRILVFDVNETLLDLSALDSLFERTFGDRAARQEWFATVLLYSQTTTIAGPYADFTAIGQAALNMTAEARQVRLSERDREEIGRAVLSLPVHADVRGALDRLRAAGFRMVTLTNSAPAAVAQQLEAAGVRTYFERLFSVDAVRRFKPAPEVYALATRELGVPADRLRLIAAHAWDILGALRAGWAAAFVARPGKVLYPGGPQPDIVESDLLSVADRIIAVE